MVAAVNEAMPHTDNPKMADKAVQDWQEILEKGSISEWLK